MEFLEFRVSGFGFGSLVSGSLLWNLAGLRRLLACTVYTTQGSIVELRLAGCKFFGYRATDFDFSGKR